MIIVFGSLNIDMVFSVDHFPQPGESVLCPDYLLTPGGKGANQAIAAARSGEQKVAMVGKIGDDAFGRKIMHSLKMQGVVAGGVGVSDQPTGCATISVNKEGENAVVISGGANLEAAADQIPEEVLNPKTVILLQMELDHEQNWLVVNNAHSAGAKVILNVAPVAQVPDEVLARIDYLVMNEIEAQQFAQLKGLENKTLEEVAIYFAKQHDLICLFTLGGKGVFFTDGVESWRQKALPVEIIDTTGAGDAFCGVLASEIHSGADLLSAVHRASVGASLSCQKLGAQESLMAIEDIDQHLDGVSPPQLV